MKGRVIGMVQTRPLPGSYRNRGERISFITEQALEETRILAECGVSIEAVMQKGEREEGKVPVVFVTHRTHESACMKAIERIKQMPEISAVSIIRVEK